MIKLPFIIEPKQEAANVGREGMGVVELPRYYALQDDKLAFVADNEISYEKLAIDTAKAIREKSSEVVSPVSATGDAAPPVPQKEDENSVIATANALLGRDYEFFVDNIDELLNFSKQKKHISRHQDVILVTAIIKYRLVSDWTIENTKDATLLTPGLFAELLKFAKEEEAGVTEEGVTDISEDIEKAA
jgi:hypothetical protein